MNLIFNDKKFKNLGWTEDEKDDEYRSATKFEDIKRRELIKLQERKRKNKHMLVVSDTSFCSNNSENVCFIFKTILLAIAVSCS